MFETTVVWYQFNGITMSEMALTELCRKCSNVAESFVSAVDGDCVVHLKKDICG